MDRITLLFGLGLYLLLSTAILSSVIIYYGQEAIQTEEQSFGILDTTNTEISVVSKSTIENLLPYSILIVIFYIFPLIAFFMILASLLLGG